MPNYVYNTVTFRPEDVDKVKALVCNNDEPFDFNKIIPMPESLNITSGSPTYDAMKYLAGKLDELTKYPDEGEEPDPSFFSEMDTLGYRSPQTLPELKVFAGIVKDNMEKYGCTDWYTWRNMHWNTKWNACDAYWVDNVCHFDTAWSDPEPVFLELSRILGISFTVECEEESLAFCSRAGYENGEKVCEQVEEGMAGLIMLGADLGDILARYDPETKEEEQALIDEYNEAVSNSK